MQGFNDRKGNDRKAQVQHQCSVVAFFEAVDLLCTKILGDIGRDRIADGDKNQRENIFYPHRCCISGKRLCAKGVYHRLHDHHADGHGGLLQDRRHRNAEHGIQLLPIEFIKGAFILPHPVQEDQKRKHRRNALCDQRGKGCAKHAQAKPRHHPEIHKNIQDGGKDQQPQRDPGLPNGGKHGGKNVVHEQKREAHKIDPQIQHRVLQNVGGGLQAAHHSTGKAKAKNAKDNAQNQKAEQGR